MDISTIIKQVRWAIDEESGSTDFVDGYMDNIIKAKINDALRWVCLYADPSLLIGSDGDSTDNPTIRSYTYAPISASTKGILPSTTGQKHRGSSSDDSEVPSYDEAGIITLPYDYLRLIRVRVSSWQKSVSTTIEEDSEEYLMQSEETSKATGSCPKVAIINDYPNKLELYPTPAPEDYIYITFAVSPSEVPNTATSSTSITIPTKVKSAFIYYLAYLVLCAYNDANKAALMLGVAKAQLGGASDKTNAG